MNEFETGVFFFYYLSTKQHNRSSFGGKDALLRAPTTLLTYKKKYNTQGWMMDRREKTQNTKHTYIQRAGYILQTQSVSIVKMCNKPALV